MRISIWKAAVAALVVAAVAAYVVLDLGRYLSLEFLKAQHVALTHYVQARPVRASVVFFLLYTGITGLSLPAAAGMTLIGGALFGTFHATLLVSFASALGATLAFLASRYVLRDWVQNRFGDRLEGINEGVSREGAFYLFAMRMVPAIPYFVINAAMGLTPMHPWTFYWVSQIGMLPKTILYAYAGSQLVRFEISGRILLALALIGLLPLIAKKVLGRRRKA